MNKRKYYAVHKGRGPVPRIYEEWTACKEAVHGTAGAQYKSFYAKEDALAYLAMKAGKDLDAFLEVHPELAAGIDRKNITQRGDLIFNREQETDVDLYVDGSYRHGVAAYGYGCVLVRDGELLEAFSGFGNKPDAVALRNVAGEMLGAVEGLRRVMALGFASVTLHFDYQGIESWATGEWKRNNQHTQAYHAFMRTMFRRLKIRFVKVMAHSGDTWNEMADRLAKEGVDKAGNDQHQES